MIQLAVEADHTTMTLFRHGHVVSSTTLEHGYQWFIEDIQNEYDLSDAVSFRLLQNVFSTEVDPELIKFYTSNRNPIVVWK